MSDSAASRMFQSLQNAAQQSDSQQMLDPQGSGQQQSDSQQPSQPHTPPAQPQQNNQDLVSDEQKLAMFEQIMQEVQQESQAQQQPGQSPQSQSPHNNQDSPQSTQTAPRSTAKEPEPASTVAQQELPGGMQYVESEPSPEIPPEVEEYLQEVQQDTAHMPEEIVIAAREQQQQQPRQLPQDVKVLPITEEQEKAGKKKNPTFSFRWLVELSEKLKKLFPGKVVYRSEE